MEESEKHFNPSPLKRANVMSKLFLWWLNPLFKIGSQRPLEVNDMYNVLEEDSTQLLTDKLEIEWNNELKKVKLGKSPSLLKAIIRTFGWEYAVWGIVAFIEEGTKVVQPLMLGGLVRYFAPGSPVTPSEAYIYALALSFCAMVLTITHHPYFFGVQRVGMWMRVACCSLLYKKSLRLSNIAMGQTTVGQVVNLMTNDVARFDQATLFLHFLWIGPLQAIAVLIILYYMLGPASLAGFSLLLLLIPLQGSMGKLFSRLRLKTAVETDERVRLMAEILSGMRVIKMYCWEKMFGDLISKVRHNEVIRIQNANLARAALLSPFFSSAKVIAFLTFLSYTLSGFRLTSETTFTVIGLYNPVRLIMTLFVPFGITLSSESWVTLKRLQTFLMLSELEESSSLIHSSKRPPQSECKITALNVKATWDQTMENLTLNDITFEVRAGELLAVIGPVGAGKSSLLMSLLGELPISSGSVKISGNIGYASQLPWVFSASVRQNILFGQKFDMKKYQKVIKAAALTKDLASMSEGDQTLVGERGVSLSGGQKARVSLARALYFDSDIYLLDDPLSAVDAAVSRHLFEKCINGYLKSKPRILVTHQLQYLKQADRILVLKEGKVVGLGTYDELVETGVDFTILLKHEENAENNKEESKDEIEEEDEFDEISLDVNDIQFNDKYNQNLLSKSFDPQAVTLLSESMGNERIYKSKSSRELVATPVEKLFNRKNKSRSELAASRTTGSYSCLPVVDPMAVGSMASIITLDPNIAPDFVAPIKEEEKRDEGTVSMKVYLQYFWTGGGCLGLFFLVLLNVLAQGTYIASDWWLSYWSTQEEDKQEATTKHQLLLKLGYNQTNVTIPDYDIYFNLYIYTGITVSVFLFGLMRALLTFKMLVDAARSLHNRMFRAVLRSPILFFDTNPVGRVLNRFSKDMGSIDETLPLTMYDFIQCALVISSIVLVAGLVNPWVFIPTVPLCAAFIYVRKYYLQTSRDIKRLEATTRSPVYSHLNASLNGLHTIRAYGGTEQFLLEYFRHQDLHSEAWFLFLTTSRWFAIRLDWLCSFFVMSVAFSSVLAAESLNGGLVGLTLTYTLSLMGLFQWGVRQSAEVENQMTSVERVIEYSRLEPEAPLESDPDQKPADAWPNHGIITGQNAMFRYAPDGPLVLKGLNFCIRAEEKVGIVGRTGAGKSSLITMLFRMAEPEGLVMIDGLDITQIGLHDLRRKISIIPQDPVLFTGTVRKNLDPFAEHVDGELWRALEDVQLKPMVEELPGKLEAAITEGGTNFSVGQRQLICLARAVLRRNKILVIDEATANVDPRTDSLIQQTIRQKFRHCTVLTIAHRLNTIMDSDRVMVLSDGKIIEFDVPYTLMQNAESDFYKMVEQTGHADFKHLLAIAHESYLSQSHSELDAVHGSQERLTNNIGLESNGTTQPHARV